MLNEKFIKKAQTVHGTKYDYSEVNYKNNKTKVKIICPIHGHFFQVPHSHTSNNSGCPNCNPRKQLTIHDFIERANEIHDHKYDYSEVEYNRSDVKVNIICPQHGIFKQTPHSHIILRAGCMKCSQLTIHDFIERANEIHDHKYDYSEVEYNRSDVKVNIICPQHGIFKQRPHNHTILNQGCPKCSHIISRGECKWLNYCNVPDTDKNRQVFLKINKQKFVVDGFIPETNTIYEYYGDYWHGNPNKFSANDINERNGKSFGELYQNTLDKKDKILKAGFVLVEMWEEEWKKIIG